MNPDNSDHVHVDLGEESDKRTENAAPSNGQVPSSESPEPSNDSTPVPDAPIESSNGEVPNGTLEDKVESTNDVKSNKEDTISLCSNDPNEM